MLLVTFILSYSIIHSFNLLILVLSFLSILSISFPEVLPAEIEKKCSSTIFPINHCHIRKVKVLKKPKFDLTKLMEMHGSSGADDSGVVLDKIAAKNTVKALAGAGGRL